MRVSNGVAVLWLLVFVAVLSEGVIAQTFTVVHTFGGLSDGAHPEGAVTFDKLGNLYGTTYGSTDKSFGSVYKIDPTGTETVLHFLRYQDGLNPFFTDVLLDSAGNLYETNGEGSYGNSGTVLKLSPTGVPTVLFAWGKPPHIGTSLGSFPEAGLIRDSTGNFYGTTSLGGKIGGGGTVYKINPITGRYTLLHSFGVSPDGCSPSGKLLIGADGDLYGTTDIGGQFGWGIIFKVDPRTGAETILYNFMDGADGGNPLSNLVQDAQGIMYSTTASGGAFSYGTIFKFDPSTAILTTLYNFGAGLDGRTPFAGVTRDQAGNMYGTTTAGGTIGYGTVYELSASGTYTVLHDFARGTDGGVPYAGVTLFGNSIYGTTALGGTSDFGVVYKIAF